MNYRSFEVIARYAHGTRAVVVHARDERHAIGRARPQLRAMVPSGYSFTIISVQQF